MRTFCGNCDTKGAMRRSCLFLQKKAFLSILPSEAGGGIRRVALSGGGQGRSAQACGIEHPENPAAIFSLRLQPAF